VARAGPRGLGAVLIAAALTTTIQCGPAAALPLQPPRDLAVQPVDFRSASDAVIRGWFVAGRAGAGAVLLLHGVDASRVAMVERARFLASAGYSVLLIDFRAHGESSGDRTTYGGLESLDARAAVDFLRAAAPGERIGVIGVSMGGAAALLGPAPLAVDALVLESVYPTIAEAVRDRLRAWLGPVGPPLASVVTGWLFPRDGVHASDLRPIDRIGGQAAPVFVLAGSADPYTTPSESKALFAHAADPKSFWLVPGAGHVDLHAFARPEYERRVGAFLARHLREVGRGVATGFTAAGAL